MFKVNLCLRVAVFAAEVASGNYHHLVGKDLKKTDARAALVAEWAPAVVDGGRGVSKELQVKILFDAHGPFFHSIYSISAPLCVHRLS